MNMVMVQDHGALNVGGGVSGDEELDMNLFHFWDFPLENDVGVNDFVGDWDDSKSECLGPIPFETLMSQTIHHSKLDHIDETRESKQLLSYVAEDSGSQTLDQMKFHDKESGVFQAHSPVSALESSGSCSTGILGLIPGKPRSKTVKQRPRVVPWSVMPPWHAAKCCRKTYKRNQERGKRFSQLSVAVELTKKIGSNSGEQQNHLLLGCGATKKCSHCQITKTPQWREGPMGPKTLCNACGVRYRSGRLFPEYRPAASPSFAPALHSNSHKKVLEMRNKANSKCAQSMML